jgi:hypothetical protein
MRHIEEACGRREDKDMCISNVDTRELSVTNSALYPQHMLPVIHNSHKKAVNTFSGMLVTYQPTLEICVGCPETSVRNCHYSLHNNPEGLSSLTIERFLGYSVLIFALKMEAICYFETLVPNCTLQWRLWLRYKIKKIGFVWPRQLFWHPSSQLT